MGKFRLKIEKSAQIDIKKHYKSGNKPTIKKIEVILYSKHSAFRRIWLNYFCWYQGEIFKHSRSYGLKS